MKDKMMAKLKEKRGESKMSDEHKSAKAGMLKNLIKEMSGMMAEPLKGMKKVTVASDSKEGLEAGLGKATEMLHERKMGAEGGQLGVPGTHDEFKENESDEASESPLVQKIEDEAGAEMHNDSKMGDIGMEPETIEEIDARIAKLNKKKEALSGKSSY